MCIFCVSLTALYAFESRGWLFGVFMSYFVTLIQGTTVFVSVLSLTVIVVNRYVVIVYPIRQRVRCKSCIYIVAAIWLLSLVVSLPTYFHTYYLDLNSIGHNMIICGEIWLLQKTERQLYSCLMLLLSYMLPLSPVLFCYCAVSYHLQKRKIPGAICHNQEKWTTKKEKTFQMLVISVQCFGLCWLPLQVANLIRDKDKEFAILNKRYVNVIQVSCHAAAMTSACFNSFVYAP